MVLNATQAVAPSITVRTPRGTARTGWPLRVTPGRPPGGTAVPSDPLAEPAEPVTFACVRAHRRCRQNPAAALE